MPLLTITTSLVSRDVFAELGIGVLEKDVRVAVFQGLSSGHDDDPVRAEDGVDPVSNGDDGAVVQRRFQNFLNQTIRFEVDVGGGFVDADNLKETSTLIDFTNIKYSTDICEYS